jgi:predicted DNA-binding transcriptional regulator AlpA
VEYTFALKYQLDPSDADLDAIVERLAEAGCDDALVGLGLPGRVALEFVREADSAEAAMTSALADVARALPTAELIEAAPDLVGITDVAELTGVSRQNIRKLMLAHAATFPTPVHAGTSSLWHLTDMVSWLNERMGYEYPQASIDVARVAERVNIEKEVRRLR